MTCSLSSGSLLLPWSRLEGLRLPSSYRSRRVSRLTGIAPGETVTLCDIPCAGCLNHIWMTVTEQDYRSLVLRMAWDDEEDLSVEAPLTDFFAVGHNQRYVPLSTPVLAVSPHNGLNTYLPMPFCERALVTLTNDGDQPVSEVYFQADYSEFDELPDCPLRFHAQWRRDNPAPRRARTYTLAEAVGRGYLAGVTYHVGLRDDADAWFHGGGDTLLIDGGTPHAGVIHGIGGEDFFGASWGIRPFETPYCGCLQCDDRLSMYRFFLESPIRFEQNLRAGFGAMANDISSVAYWYQTEPHHRFFRLPPAALRAPESDLAAEDYDVELLPAQQGVWAVIGPFGGGIEDRHPPEEFALRPRGTNLREPGFFETDYTGPFGDQWPTSPPRVTWQRARTDLWWLDLNALFAPKYKGPTCVQKVRGVAYILGRVSAPRDWRARLLVAYDDALKIWLDGRLIHSGVHTNGCTTESMPVEMRRGTNSFFIKTTNADNANWAAWCLSLRLCQPDGMPTDALVYDPLSELGADGG